MIRVLSFVAAASVLSGCVTSVDDIHHFSTQQVGSSLTMVTASSQIIVTNPDGTICVGPPPDATADLGFAASVSVLSGGGTDGGSAAEEELPLGGRNPNVLVTRDILFQSCLAEARLGLSEQERKDHYKATMELLAKVNSQSLEGSEVESESESGDQQFALPGND